MHGVYQNNRGFMRFLLIAVVVIIVLSYYNFDLRSAVESPQTRENFSYIFYVWDTYIWETAKSVGYVLIDLLNSARANSLQ